MPDVALAYESYHYKENTDYSLHSLDGKYVEITGVLGHIDESDMGDSSLQIYFDGELHKEVPLLGEMVAQPFSIDVTGVNQLKLMVSHGPGSYGYADVTIH